MRGANVHSCASNNEYCFQRYWTTKPKLIYCQYTFNSCSSDDKISSPIRLCETDSRGRSESSEGETNNAAFGADGLNDGAFITSPADGDLGRTGADAARPCFPAPGKPTAAAPFGILFLEVVKVPAFSLNVFDGKLLLEIAEVILA